MKIKPASLNRNDVKWSRR